MDLDSDTETSLTNQHIFELYEFDEDNLEEEFEATNNIDESCEDNLQEEVETNNDTCIFFNFMCVWLLLIPIIYLMFLSHVFM